MGKFLSTCCGLCPRTPPKILMVGLDNAGKTMVLCNLKFGNVSYANFATLQTVGFNVEAVELEGEKYEGG